MPHNVSLAIKCIWFTIALSVLAALFNRLTGVVSMGEFCFYIIVYAIYCIFPYKLGRASNPMRWAYLILTAASIFLLLGGIAEDMPKADVVVSLVCIPVSLFACYLLLKKDAAAWFGASSAR
jgi:hypothetical protein